MTGHPVQPDRSRHRGRKDELRATLADRNHAALRAWGATDRNPLRTLHMLLWDQQALLRWRAIEAIGLLVRDRFANQTDLLREFVRKLIWSMNDESGSLCPHAPEAIAEILFHSTTLRTEFLEPWLSYLDEEPFEIGMRAGLIRLSAAPLTRDEFHLLQTTASALMTSLQTTDPVVRGISLSALLALGLEIPPTMQSTLRNDHAAFECYDFADGDLVTVTIASCLERKSPGDWQRRDSGHM